MKDLNVTPIVKFLDAGAILHSLALSCRRRQWHPTPVLLPGKSHGRRSLEGCSTHLHYQGGYTFFKLQTKGNSKDDFISCQKGKYSMANFQKGNNMNTLLTPQLKGY